MKAFITVHRYDGALYATLVAEGGKPTLLAESTLYVTPFPGMIDMKRWANAHNITVTWCDSRLQKDN